MVVLATYDRSLLCLFVSPPARDLLSCQDGITSYDRVIFFFVCSRLYWAEAGQISRSDLTGGNARSVVTAVSPSGVTIDFLRRRLVWGDSATGTIESSRLSGSQRTTLASGIDPFKVSMELGLGSWE